MSKAIVIGIVSAGGAGAVGIGGYSLFGNGFGFGGGSDTSVTPRSDASKSNPSDLSQTQVQTTPQRIVSTQETGGDARIYDQKLETLDNLNEVVKKGECFKGAFGDSISLADTTNSDSIDLTNTDYFGNPIIIPAEESDSDNQTPTGCVFVQTKKVKYSNNKYTGIFSWAWAFRGDKGGFVVFGLANTSEQNQNLDVEGVVYLLTKSTADSGTDTGTVTYSKKSDKKQLSSNEAWDKLPKANTTKISGSLDHEDWQWLSQSDLNNIADSTATDGNAEPASYQPKWKYDSEEPNTKIYDGCKDLNGLDYLFGTTFSTLKNKLENWKGGG